MCINRYRYGQRNGYNGILGTINEWKEDNVIIIWCWDNLSFMLKKMMQLSQAIIKGFPDGLKIFM